MGKWQEFLYKLRKKLDSHGYVCDACGREIFQYPKERICKACAKLLEKPSGCRCVKCGRKTFTEGVCLTCKKSLPKFTRGLSPFVYVSETASIINRIKNGNPRLAYAIGKEMALLFAAEYPEKQAVLIVPVPLTQNRIWQRGYNQAQRLAEAIEEELKSLGYEATLDTAVLEKKKETEKQKALTGLERSKNVEGVYHVHKRKECRDKTVLLIDDIMTTGATGSECAARLLGAGAKEVLFLVGAALPERKD